MRITLVKVDLFGGRKRGLVATDAAGKQYILRLGPGLEIDGDELVVIDGPVCDRLIALDPPEEIFTSDGDQICCEGV